MEKELKYSIKSVVNLTGLTDHVIRIWERRYNIVEPTRTETNRRLYSIKDVEKLQLVSKALEIGHSIGRIANLSIPQLRELVGEKFKFQNNFKSQDNESLESIYINRCIEAIKNLDAKKLENELLQGLIHFSQPKFLANLLTPLLERIGELWKSGEIRIVNEHVSTAVIRKLLTSLIDNNAVGINAPKIIVATPKGQHHELGALIISVIASADGWNVTYMGPDLPGEEIAAAIENLHPKIVALSVVYPNDDFTLEREMNKLKGLLNNGSKIIAGGKSAVAYKSALDSMNAKIINDIDTFRAELEKVRQS